MVLINHNYLCKLYKKNYATFCISRITYYMFSLINFDGAVFSKENKSGASIVIWKREGFMFAAQSWQFNQAYSPSAIEAVAAHTNL